MASRTRGLNERFEPRAAAVGVRHAVGEAAGPAAPESPERPAKSCSVSVIVATIDRPALLREALASIRAIERDGVSFEILVGDTGVLPETAAVAAEFGAVYQKVAEQGCAPARNAVMRLASGDYIAFLDDDDLWTPHHIHGHLALFNAQPDLGAVVGQVLMTDAERRPFFEPWPRDLPSGRELLIRMLSGYFPQVGATVVRADVARAVGDMDESLVGGTDWDWQLRIARRYAVGFVPQTCVLFQQRAPGKFDALQLRRMPFTRKIFFRHALAEWRIWRSPFQFARSYFGTVTQFFNYFVEAAIERAKLGDSRGSMYAIGRATVIFPTRALRMMTRPTPLRMALVTALTNCLHSIGV